MTYYLVLFSFVISNQVGDHEKKTSCMVPSAEPISVNAQDNYKYVFVSKTKGQTYGF